MDPGRIGAWGTSCSGGHVLILSAIDPRVKVAVSNVPSSTGTATCAGCTAPSGCASCRTWSWKTAASGSRPVSTATSRCRPPRRARRRARYLAPGRGENRFRGTPAHLGPRHEHRSTLASVDLLTSYNAAPSATRLVNKPVMMIIADSDDITLWDVEIQVFDSIPTLAKELVVLPATSHMTLYGNLAARAADSWFTRHLGQLPTVTSKVNEYTSK